MKIYAIYNIPNQTYLKIGINGGGAIGYCLYRGKKVFCHKKTTAQSVINTFDNPHDYEIHEFTQVKERC